MGKTIFKVTQGWQATYDDPIRFKAGEVVFLSGREENWDGHIWLWAKSAEGLEGWIPDTIISKSQAGSVAREDYTAVELSCDIGQSLTGEKETHGWVFCRAMDGATGWVPRKNLAL